MARPRHIRSVLFGKASALAATLYPPACPMCRAEAAEIDGVCATCWRDLSFIAVPGCWTCGRPMPGVPMPEPDLVCDSCMRTDPVWRRGRAVLHYGGTGRRMILGLKHGDRADLLPLVTRWMMLSAGDIVAATDVIVPIPLHWRRRIKRRFNQSADLARHLSRAAGKPGSYRPAALWRQSFAGSQDGRNNAERRANVDGVFRARPKPVRGRSVLLIDDVMTTGATLNAASRALLAAGAVHVDVLVLALVTRDTNAYIAGAREEFEDETG